MRKFFYRVTKYDPALRNSRGHYSGLEWTSFLEVPARVTLQEYLRVEQSYLDSALQFLTEQKVENLRLKGLENHAKHTIDGMNLKEGQRLSNRLLPAIMRDILREKFWAKLENGQAFVHFGWDFYMYIWPASR